MKLRSINPFTCEVTAEFDPLPDEACREAVLKGKKAFGKWRKTPHFRSGKAYRGACVHFKTEKERNTPG